MLNLTTYHVLCRILTFSLQGKYTVLADVYDKDQKKITCLTASIVFKRGGAFEVLN